jgi:hypothetical protein
MKRTVMLGGALVAFGLLTVVSPANAEPPTLVCDEQHVCNIIDQTIANYAKLPGEAIENWSKLPGETVDNYRKLIPDTVDNYRNLVPDTIKNYTGVDIRKQQSGGGATAGATGGASGPGAGATGGQ